MARMEPSRWVKDQSTQEMVSVDTASSGIMAIPSFFVSHNPILCLFGIAEDSRLFFPCLKYVSFNVLS
jgi:hypothetical protein